MCYRCGCESIKILNVYIGVVDGLWGVRKRVSDGKRVRWSKGGCWEMDEICSFAQSCSTVGELYKRVDPFGQIVATNFTKNMLHPVRCPGGFELQ